MIGHQHPEASLAASFAGSATRLNSSSGMIPDTDRAPGEMVCGSGAVKES